MREKLVAGVNADPVVEPAREARLEFNSEAMLALGKRSSLGEFVRMAHRRALVRAAHEDELDANVFWREAIQPDPDIDEKKFAELDARLRRVEPTRGHAVPCRPNLGFPCGHRLRAFV